MARSAARAAWVTSRGASPSPPTFFDEDALTDAMAGHDVVLNLATNAELGWRQVVVDAASRSDP